MSSKNIFRTESNNIINSSSYFRLGTSNNVSTMDGNNIYLCCVLDIQNVTFKNFRKSASTRKIV
jgi:hypothetical protein